MKTIVPANKTVKALILSVSFLTIFAKANCQTTATELVFDNVVLTSGAAGADGSIYTFNKVSPSLDAQVKITGRSSALVSLTTIDLTSSGFSKAFQPQVKYSDGTVASAKTWWMEFEISFVNKGTTTPATISSFNVTGLDIDGDNSTLKEMQTFYGAGSYTTETGTLLTPATVTGTIANAAQTGKSFTGTVTDHPGIDTAATGLMATLTYASTSKLTVRVGATTTGSSSGTERMYSMWFKAFEYITPVLKSLPVKLTAFNAMLVNHTNRVDLSWTTASEKDVNHFEVEKSLDGKNFTTVAVVLAAGNSDVVLNYKYTDNINLNDTKIVYYRLRSVDENGKYEFSATRIIRIGSEDNNTIALLTYPNPVVNELRVTIPSNWQGKKVTYELINANGQVSKRSESTNSSQTETINMSTVAPGFYIVAVTCDGVKAQQKVIKN